MRVEITQPGVRAKGKELKVGDVIDVKGDTMPPSLVNKAVEMKGEKTAITNPAVDPVHQPVGYAVSETSPGWFVITKDGVPVTKKLRQSDLDGFDTMSDDDKAAFADLHKVEA